MKELESEKELGREVSECEEETSTTVSYKIVDSHCHPHLNQERVEEYLLSPQGDKETNDYKNINVLELACAVSQKDWQSCLDYASEKQPTVIPAIGVHPWYVMDELSENWLEELEYLLLAHPSAFVGEIGLCKCARDVRFHPAGKQAALQKQRDVFFGTDETRCKVEKTGYCSLCSANGANDEDTQRPCSREQTDRKWASSLPTIDCLSFFHWNFRACFTNLRPRKRNLLKC